MTNKQYDGLLFLGLVLSFLSGIIFSAGLFFDRITGLIFFLFYYYLAAFILKYRDLKLIKNDILPLPKGRGILTTKTKPKDI